MQIIITACLKICQSHVKKCRSESEGLRAIVRSLLGLSSAYPIECVRNLSSRGVFVNRELGKWSISAPIPSTRNNCVVEH
jgi:hypothetical protein